MFHQPSKSPVPCDQRAYWLFQDPGSIDRRNQHQQKYCPAREFNQWMLWFPDMKAISKALWGMQQLSDNLYCIKTVGIS